MGWSSGTAEMTWSRDQPTTPDGYWYREAGLNGGSPMPAWIFGEFPMDS